MCVRCETCRTVVTVFRVHGSGDWSALVSCSFVDLTYAVEGQRFSHRFLSSCFTAAEVAPSPMMHVALGMLECLLASVYSLVIGRLLCSGHTGALVCTSFFSAYCTSYASCEDGIHPGQFQPFRCLLRCCHDSGWTSLP